MKSLYPNTILTLSNRKEGQDTVAVYLLPNYSKKMDITNQ